MDGTPIDTLLDPWLDATCKGYPASAPPLRRSQVGAQGWRVLAGDLPLPLAVIRQQALAHNLAWMQRLADEAGVALAPHGKTTMSPQLFQAQLAAGARAITVATLQQLVVAVAAGARRVLIANQWLQQAELAALSALLRQTPGLRAPFLIDSAEQIALIEQAGLPTAFDVLLELGLPGGRTGVRDDGDALALARRVHASPALRLVGVEAYEGLWATGDDTHDAALVQTLLQRLHTLVDACSAAALFDETEPPIVSAGGSAVFDLVARGLRPPGGRPVQALLRSGCYVTHDSGAYQRYVHAVNRRLGCSDASGLRAALEVWAVVQSQPEPGLALVNAGKRDVSSDWGLPVPLKFCRAGDEVVQPAPSAWVIDKLNDQHAYLRFPPAGDRPRVGDRVALGISHPCATFDKWRWMVVVDEAYQVVDAITTAF